MNTPRTRSRFFASGVVTPLVDQAGAIIGFTEIARDVTEQQKSRHVSAAARRRSEAAAIAGEVGNTTHLLGGESPRVKIRSHHGTLDPAKARAWLHLNMAMLDHAVRRSCQAAPASIPNGRKAFDSLVTTIRMKPRSGIYSGVDPALRASAKSLLETWKEFNGDLPLNPQRKAERMHLNDDGDGAVREEAA